MASAEPSVRPLEGRPLGVTTNGGIGLSEGETVPGLLVSRYAPPMTTAPITTAMAVQTMSVPNPLPEDPDVPARARARLASRLARRCCRAERRLVVCACPSGRFVRRNRLRLRRPEVDPQGDQETKNKRDPVRLTPDAHGADEEDLGELEPAFEQDSDE